PSTIATHALISLAASGYSCMASLRCLRVTICTDQWYFTICEVVKRDCAPQNEACSGKPLTQQRHRPTERCFLRLRSAQSGRSVRITAVVSVFAEADCSSLVFARERVLHSG